MKAKKERLAKARHPTSLYFFTTFLGFQGKTLRKKISDVRIFPRDFAYFIKSGIAGMNKGFLGLGQEELKNVILKSRLESAIEKLNPEIPQDTKEVTNLSCED